MDMSTGLRQIVTAYLQSRSRKQRGTGPVNNT